MPLVMEHSVGDLCYDDGAPFEILHVGKLIALSEVSNPVTPHNHCLVQGNDPDQLSLIRFSIFDYDYLSAKHKALVRRPFFSLSQLVSSSAEAARMHERHLEKLGAIGLRPWYAELRAGKLRTLENAPGVFLLQDILPEGTVPGSFEPDFYEALEESLDEYKAWASQKREPGYLYDIDTPAQYSKLPDGSYVLHDVELAYAPIGTLQPPLAR